MAIPSLNGWLLPRLDWFTGCGVVTAPVSQPHGPLKCALGLGVWQQYGFLHLTICAQTESGRARETSWQRGASHHLSALSGAMPYYPESIGSFSCHWSFPSPPSLWLISERERRGPEGIYVDKYVENWLSMDLFARADLFVWRQTEVAFVCLPAEPWLSPSMARHSGDKHQLAGPLHRHHHFLPESADYILEVDSLLSLWIAGGLNLLFFSGLALGWGVVGSGHWFRRLPLLVPSAVTHTVNRPLSPPALFIFL